MRITFSNKFIGSVRQFLIHEVGFVEAMVYMFQNCRSLSDHVLTCLGTMICAGIYIFLFVIIIYRFRFFYPHS